jgi:TolB protein
VKRAVLLALSVVALTASNVHAAFPGNNGKIAFTSNRDGNLEIYSMNPEGSGLTRLTNDPAADVHPHWSPDGTKIVFARGHDVYTMNADGTGLNLIATTSAGQDATLMNTGTVPTWSPDGTRIAFSDWGIYSVPAIGGAKTQIIGSDCPPAFFRMCIGYEGPAWSPGGEWIEAERVEYLHEREGIGPLWGSLVRIRADGSGTISGTTALGPRWPDWSPSGARIVYADGGEPSGSGYNLWTMNPDASGQTQLTAGPDYEVTPAWSPDGTKIAFAEGPFGAPLRIHVMDASGANEVELTTGSDSSPDWQSIPINSHARPKGATPSRFSLLPAYSPCGSANRTHGPPLAFPSCAPPVPSSPHLTIATPDVNGHNVRFIGSLRSSVVAGNPATPADEADVALEISTIDVRCSPTDPPSTCGPANNTVAPTPDYTGELQGVAFVRITDRNNTPHPGGPGAATVEDFDLRVTTPCASTPSDVFTGSTCAVSTTVDAVVPGAVKEGHRAIWELDRVHVRDGGPDGVAATADNRVFARPGLFVP